MSAKTASIHRRRRRKSKIADKLTITLSAVKKHTGNIFGKLSVTRRTQAMACHMATRPPALATA